mgnify:CR=1 FL=1
MKERMRHLLARGQADLQFRGRNFSSDHLAHRFEPAADDLFSLLQVGLKATTQRQKPMRKSKPQARGSEIDANGVPNVLAVMLFTPVTY